MRSAFVKLFALAAIAALAFHAPAFAAKDEGGHKDGEHKTEAKPEFFVKDGDKYRPATEAELKAVGGHDDGHGGGGGLGFTGIHRYDLGIYTLIVFAILMFVLSRFAWPHIKAGLEKRESNILSALDEARKSRAESSELMARAKKELDETAGKVRAMLDEARKDAEALKATEKERGEKEAQEIKARADREAATKKDADLKEVQKQAVELAVLIATKALRQQVTIENQHKLLNDSIAELGNAGGSKA